MKNFSRLSISTIVLSIVAACGGAGGDNGLVTTNDAEIELIEPVVGLWILPGDWNGTSNDEAYLSISRPDTKGVAKAQIYDLDDAIAGAESNCYIVDGGEGEVRVSLDNQLFLNLPVYDSAIVALSPNGQLEISVLAQGSVSGTERELLAVREISITETDIELCVN